MATHIGRMPPEIVSQARSLLALARAHPERLRRRGSHIQLRAARMILRLEDRALAEELARAASERGASGS